MADFRHGHGLISFGCTKPYPECDCWGESITEVMPSDRPTAAKLPTHLSKHLGVGAKATPNFLNAIHHT
ncbi:hypothetical protein N0Y54_42705 [Nostoc punctiforme UO1]|uniref:hypothetical protein n=1 Tax=Nostoc punctiforme TaxID=272131 RepID=UPI0030975BAC